MTLGDDANPGYEDEAFRRVSEVRPGELDGHHAAGVQDMTAGLTDRARQDGDEPMRSLLRDTVRERFEVRVRERG